MVMTNSHTDRETITLKVVVKLMVKIITGTTRKDPPGKDSAIIITATGDEMIGTKPTVAVGIAVRKVM